MNERMKARRDSITKEIEIIAVEFAQLTYPQGVVAALLLLKQISMQLDLLISELPEREETDGKS